MNFDENHEYLILNSIIGIIIYDCELSYDFGLKSNLNSSKVQLEFELRVS